MKKMFYVSRHPICIFKKVKDHNRLLNRLNESNGTTLLFTCKCQKRSIIRQFSQNGRTVKMCISAIFITMELKNVEYFEVNKSASVSDENNLFGDKLCGIQDTVDLNCATPNLRDIFRSRKLCRLHRPSPDISKCCICVQTMLC